MRKTAAVLALAMMGMWVTSAQAGIDFHVAGTKPIQGFQKVTIEGSTIYVAPRAAFVSDIITSSNAVESRDGTDIEMTVRPDTIKKLTAMMKKNDADRLVAYAGGRIIGAGVPELDAKDGRITITGMKPELAQRLTRVLNGASIAQLGPAITLAPSATSITPGGIITVDVFAANMDEFRVYQVALDIRGGRTGELTVSDLKIDASRSNFAFSGLKKIDAVDPSGGRLGAMLFEGTTTIVKPAYLGTFTLASSNDAAGDFTIMVRTSDESSFVKDGGNQGIEFFTDGAMTITVGKAERIRGEGK